jgi:hypothetical protein
MARFRPEVDQFFKASEAVQILLANGERLTPDEQAMIQMLCTELLETCRSNQNSKRS